MNNIIFQSPKAIKAELSRHIFGQDELLEQIACLFFVYCNRINCGAIGKKFKHPESVLISGPTGSGKTYIAQKLAELSGLPLLHIDCTTLSLPGWKGTSLVDQLLTQLQEAKIDSSGLAIVLLDEIDKLTANKESNLGEYNSATQTNIMSCLEGNLTLVVECNDKAVRSFGPMRNIFIIAAGTFHDHFKYQTKSENLRQDILDSGLVPELVNRFTLISSTNPVDTDLLIDRLLAAPDSPLNFYKTIFKYAGNDLNLTSVDLDYLKLKLKNSSIRELKAQLFKLLIPKLMSLVPKTFSYNEFKQLTNSFGEKNVKLPKID